MEAGRINLALIQQSTTISVGYSCIVLLYITLISNPQKQDTSKSFKVDLAEPDDYMMTS
jgi:hypothetical protein